MNTDTNAQQLSFDLCGPSARKAEFDNNDAADNGD